MMNRTVEEAAGATVAGEETGISDEDLRIRIRLQRWQRRAARRWCIAEHPETGRSCMRAEGHRGPHRSLGMPEEWRG